MDFTLSKQQQMVQKMYKEFAENEVKPLAKKVDAEAADSAFFFFANQKVEYAGCFVDGLKFRCAVDGLERIKVDVAGAQEGNLPGKNVSRFAERFNIPCRHRRGNKIRVAVSSGERVAEETFAIPVAICPCCFK